MTNFFEVLEVFKYLNLFIHGLHISLQFCFPISVSGLDLAHLESMVSVTNFFEVLEVSNI